MGKPGSGGTSEGGKKAAATNKRRHGADFYGVIGAKGGRAPCGDTAGFKNRELAQWAGSIGGSLSRRGRKLTAQERSHVIKKLSRNDYLQEQHEEARERMKALARKYA